MQKKAGVFFTSDYTLRNSMEKMIEKLNPITWDYAYWRKFFLVAAIWNFSGAIPGIFFPAFSMRLFYGVQTGNFHTLLLQSLFFGAVLMFGVGYLIVSLAPEKNSGIVFLGAVSKSIMAIVWYYIYFSYNDYSTIFSIIAATGDTIFTIYFAYFLIKRPLSTIHSS